MPRAAHSLSVASTGLEHSTRRREALLEVHRARCVHGGRDGRRVVLPRREAEVLHERLGEEVLVVHTFARPREPRRVSDRVGSDLAHAVIAVAVTKDREIHVLAAGSDDQVIAQEPHVVEIGEAGRLAAFGGEVREQDAPGP